MPAHLPRIETIVDVEDKACPCCKGELHLIGEDVSERLDIIPAQFRVLVVRRPKYACRSCEDGVMGRPFGRRGGPQRIESVSSMSRCSLDRKPARQLSLKHRRETPPLALAEADAF